MSYECNKPFCNKLNWVQDEHDPNHYVCLKCGNERWVDDDNFSIIGSGFFHILILLIVVILLPG